MAKSLKMLHLFLNKSKDTLVNKILNTLNKNYTKYASFNSFHYVLLLTINAPTVFFFLLMFISHGLMSFLLLLRVNEFHQKNDTIKIRENDSIY